MTIIEIAKRAEEYCEMQNCIKQFEKRAEILKAEMMEELKLRGTDTLRAGFFNINWVTCSNSRIDTAALKKAFPDIAAQCTKETVTHRFQVTV